MDGRPVGGNRRVANWRWRGPLRGASGAERESRMVRGRHQPDLRQWRLVSSDLTTSAQPSTSTNSRILKGSDTRTGGSIIMSIDMSDELTIKSITKNGMKTMKPMMNAVFSSESTNAGTSAVMLTSSDVLGLPLPSALVNMA